MLDWARSYLKETEEVRRTGKTMVIFDGFAIHLSLRVLHLLPDAGVIVYALPSHSSPLTHPLDVTVFGPMKKRAKQTMSTYINNPLNAASKLTVYAACEMICTAYDLAMTPSRARRASRNRASTPQTPTCSRTRRLGSVRFTTRTQPRPLRTPG